VSRFSAEFFQQADRFDHHPAIHRLAHVIDGEQGDAGGGERLHFDAGAAKSFRHGAAFNGMGAAILGFIQTEVDGDFGQRNGMAERDQVSGAFCRHDACQSGDTKNVAFVGDAVANHRQRGRLHDDTTGGDGDSPRFGFFADANHQRAALVIEMGKVVHGDKGTGGEGKYHSPMQKLRSIALALLVAFPAQAIELPDLGEVSRVALSEANEDRIGREIMRQIYDSAHYLDDSVLIEYLNSIGERLAASSPDPSRRFEFFPVRDSSINAFALPGGFIGVHTGLIAAARNESELASVLAHEIAHVTQSHIARIVDGQKSSGLASLAALAIAILAARSNPDAAQAAIVTAQAVSIQNQLDFTREHEREADRVGLQTLLDARFSAQGMGTFFERLQAQGRLYENNAPAYLRTHPLTYERIADIQNRIAAIPYQQVADSLEFSLVRARVQAAEGEARDAVSVFTVKVREQPSAAAWYGLSMASLRAGDWPQAERALDSASALTTDSPLLDLARAELLMASGKAAEAVKVSAAALQKNSAYRPLAYQHAKALLVAGQAREALDFLGERLRIWSSDGALFALKAQAHQALGQTTESFLAQAEAYVLTDRIGAAIDQLQFAQRQGKADFFTLSIIDARLRELRARQQRDMPQ